jgi:hypothetical protein
MYMTINKFIVDLVVKSGRWEVNVIKVWNPPSLIAKIANRRQKSDL